MKTILPISLLLAPSKSENNPLVIYHGKQCPDGFTAALAAWIFFEGHAEFLGLDHGDIKTIADLPDVAGRSVYILDFSFAPGLMRELEQRAAKLVVLDHHKSAYQQLADFECRCGVVHFDMNKSGARLAWEFFLPNEPLPELVKLVEDRDIWVWQYPHSAAFLAALDTETNTFERWLAIAQFDAAHMAAYVERGRAMDDKFHHLAADLLKGAMPLTFNGIKGLMLNAPGAFHSELGDILSRQSGTFALLWHVDKVGNIKAGLRSQREFDCIALARSMGGGGHAQACGFKMPVTRLPELLSGEFTS